jgi:ferredoxin
MKVGGKTVLLCSCEGSMPVDGKALAKAFGTDEPKIHHQLCRAGLAAYHELLGTEPLLVACGQEASLFAELAEQAGAEAPGFVDIRDRAGWSEQAGKASAKMAALIAEAAVELDSTPVVTLSSAGRIVVLGEDEVALETARRLSADRAVQLVVTGPGTTLTPPGIRGFTLWRGRPIRAEGALGNWTLTIEALAAVVPSARGALAFEPAQQDASLITADIVLDLTGQASLGRGRDGWLAVDSRVPAAVERAMAEALGLLGEFEKPRYIRIDPSFCAHSRNSQIACTRCIDVCPSSSIIGKGDAVVIDAQACGGHGACASACPTGAIRYDFPAGNGLYTRLAAMLGAYRAAAIGAQSSHTGTAPVLLAHDAEHGGAVIGALARFGAGLPANVLPFALNAVAVLGADFLLTALSHGIARIVAFADPKHHVDLAPLRDAAGLANRVMARLGWAARVEILVATDPAELAAALAAPVPAAVAPAAEFLVLGNKRQTLGLALSHLHRHASIPVDVVALAAGDPFGALVLDVEKCTLCLACVPACPASALSGHADKPSLGFTEANCVQCGLCRVTCPEKAITFKPQINFSETARNRLTLKEEDPFACIRCGKPFGTKSSIERMVERLSGHSMFVGTNRLDLIKMCDGCRVEAQSTQ